MKKIHQEGKNNIHVLWTNWKNFFWIPCVSKHNGNIFVLSDISEASSLRSLLFEGPQS